MRAAEEKGKQKVGASEELGGGGSILFYLLWSPCGLSSAKLALLLEAQDIGQYDWFSQHLFAKCHSDICPKISEHMWLKLWCKVSDQDQQGWFFLNTLLLSGHHGPREALDLLASGSPLHLPGSLRLLAPFKAAAPSASDYQEPPMAILLPAPRWTRQISNLCTWPATWVNGTASVMLLGFGFCFLIPTTLEYLDET